MMATDSEVYEGNLFVLFFLYDKIHINDVKLYVCVIMNRNYIIGNISSCKRNSRKRWEIKSLTSRSEVRSFERSWYKIEDDWKTKIAE